MTAEEPVHCVTITILAVNGIDQNRKLINAVKKTIQRKLNYKRKQHYELKGITASLETKKYFYQEVKDIKFGLYSITIDKKKSLNNLIKNKDRIYNFTARKVIDAIPFEESKQARVELIVDKSKGTSEINEFNIHIKKSLEARIDPNTPIDIYHRNSLENYGLQACDMFCYGISQKNERGAMGWFNIFEIDKIKFDQLLELKRRAL